MKTNFDFSKHNKKILYTVFGVSLYSILFHGILMNDFDFAKIIGTVIGLILFPFIVSVILNFIYKKISGNENGIFFKLFIFFVVLSVLSNLISNLNKKEEQVSENKTINLKEEPYIYNPSSSNFTIKFPQKPKSSKTIFFIDSLQIEGEMVELTINEPESLLRVEYLKNDLVNSLEENSIIEMFNLLVFKDGMYNPEIKKVDDLNWKEYELRMYKNLESVESKELIPITYRVRCIIIKDEMIIISTGCQSSLYPTVQISDFNNSFNLNYS
ncbi:MAG: hypothetical protein HWE07_02640 [Cytophagia bacterium]|nr:hypothetical protein [Cytophagia bacterium]